MHVMDQAEERVLFNLEAMLEKALTTPLQADYAQHNGALGEINEAIRLSAVNDAGSHGQSPQRYGMLTLYME
jgi:hypothetical protein